MSTPDGLRLTDGSGGEDTVPGGDEAFPLTDAQLRFAVIAESTGRRVCVPLLFRMPPGAVATAVLQDVLDAMVTGNPALSCRVDLAHGTPVQRWHGGGCGFETCEAPSAERASRLVADAVEAFEESTEPDPMAARLIRVADGDLLLLMFDHTVVDEQSLGLVKRQLSDPPPSTFRTSDPSARLRRYEAAVRDRVQAEAEASRGGGPAFWRARLEEAGEHLPRRSEAQLTVAAVHTPEPVEIPDDLRGSVYQLVLAALHRALRDLDGDGPTVVGYTWGQRNTEFADVVGCFMNTVLSVDTTGEWSTVGAGIRAFRRGWWREIDHAAVPFSTVVASGATLAGRPWGGHIDTVLIFEHAPADPGWTVAGVPAEEIEPEHAVPNAPVAAAVVAREGELRLRIAASRETPDDRVEALGRRWRHWLGEILSYSRIGDT
ncbi:condensation domain-containing protein [Streptomyces sp. JJ38]|uniref:condensation domain-containing protein n=1 Tax=Streptomyces sp. JJ38 TaxID=2738128 RepID=UPI001C59D019|nr:condensation domain-containing protein [Streptomyces sp. JJ38]MBW1598380.1 hypothetical protein [Streptomyces sp. JJ38]